MRLTKDFAVCSSCRPRARLRRVWVCTAYTGAARLLVGRYKFQRAKAASTILAEALDATLPFLPDNTFVTFVPTATSRLRIRGYDQAELVARRFAKIRRLPCKRLVTRTTQTRQLGANRHQRHTQLKRAFSVVKPSRCAGQNILVIDDVLTTGSTVEAVAQALRAAGAKHVDAAVFAQKV